MSLVNGQLLPRAHYLPSDHVRAPAADIFSCPILSYPTLSYPILSYPIIFERPDSGPRSKKDCIGLARPTFSREKV